MKLYLDSNAFVALYADDQTTHAQITREAIAKASTQASSPITYPEVRAAFKALKQHKRITHREYKQAVNDFESDWAKVQTVDVDSTLALYAGGLADALQLKSCDAVHVATAATLHAISNDLEFLTFDQQLEKRIHDAGIVPLWQAKP